MSRELADAWRRRWRGGAAWLVAWVAMVLLDGHIDLGNQALILVLAAALAALWLPAALSMTLCAIAVTAFNVAFVPPRGRFSVDLERDALLLVTTLVVSWLVALMVSRQRRLAAKERELFLRADQLRRLGEALRDAEDPRSSAALLQQALSALSGGPVVLLMLAEAPADTTNPRDVQVAGEANDEERVAMWLCLRQRTSAAAFPPSGTSSWYVPLRGRAANYGVALMRFPAAPADATGLYEHVQALCDQMGLALERSSALRSAASAREGERVQALRNALLSAIAHDHRTPLATILGAASSLAEQGDRLAPDQRLRLASTIVDEATQLARLTDNTLQLARLDTSRLALNLDWESIEELVGSVVRRVRHRRPQQRIEVRIAPGLPLLRCDAVLLVQLLDNLIDNAFKYGGGAVEVEAGSQDGRVVIAVRDRGPGVPAEWRSRIFEAFQRAPAAAGNEAARRGAGVGLTVCRAIAIAHGGELVLRERAGGGASFELVLPVTAQPDDRAAEAAPGAA